MTLLFPKTHVWWVPGTNRLTSKDKIDLVDPLSGLLRAAGGELEGQRAIIQQLASSAEMKVL